MTVASMVRMPGKAEREMVPPEPGGVVPTVRLSALAAGCRGCRTPGPRHRASLMRAVRRARDVT